MEGAEHIRWVFEHTGCAAVMLARGALGNPWLFAQVLGERADEPSADEVLAEWHWVIDRAEEHLGPDRAARYLRKFHPWYVERLGAPQGGSGRAAARGRRLTNSAPCCCYPARPPRLLRGVAHRSA